MHCVGGIGADHPHHVVMIIDRFIGDDRGGNSIANHRQPVEIPVFGGLLDPLNAERLHFADDVDRDLGLVIAVEVDFDGNILADRLAH